MFYSQTDRHEKEWPAEVPFRYMFRAGNRRMNVVDRRVPRTVVHRDAIAAADDNGAGYARMLIGVPRGDTKPVAPRVARVAARAAKPVKKLTPQQEYDAAVKELAAAQAELAKINATLATLNK